MLGTAILSYIAGLLTAFAPCVLPLLPIILGGSIDPKSRDKKRPYIIVGSLVVSLILFTLLLKASTALIGINPKVWTYISGGLVIGLGMFMLFPDQWAKIISKLGFEHRSQELLGKAYKNKNSLLSAILIGAALGPVFSSCSPTYAWVIATVLPSSAALGLFYLSIYVLGVATSLLAIALLGRKLLEKVKWASDPRGWFQRGIAVLFIIVGLLVITGWDKKIQTFLVEKDFTGIKSIEEKLVPNTDGSRPSGNYGDSSFNVTPYSAPEFSNINAWINSEPLTLESLKGKVVLIDFWTYSCINCIRTQPYLNAWHNKYSQEGLVIVGVHAPEFAFEKVVDNVKEAVIDAEIKYPVALDNDFSTWQAYNNRYWPAKYLIDKDGKVRYTHFGEGDYDVTEANIQTLLRDTGSSVSKPLEANTSTAASSDQTPETYLGYDRGERFANADEFVADEVIDYKLSSDLEPNQWSLGGNWQMNSESSQSHSDKSILSINYTAKEVFLVMSGPPGAAIEVAVTGLSKPSGDDLDGNNRVILDTARLYKLVKEDQQESRTLTLKIPTGVTINAFTFGS